MNQWFVVCGAKVHLGVVFSRGKVVWPSPFPCKILFFCTFFIFRGLSQLDLVECCFSFECIV